MGGRNPETVVAGYLAWRRAQDPAQPLDIVAVERPSVGFSTETLLIDIRTGGSDETTAESVVVKLPPADPGIFPAYDFGLQARVQNAVAAAGIPAPSPAQAVDDLRWLGSPFLVMPAIDGHIVDEVPARDRWLSTGEPARNAGLYRRYLDVIAAVHRFDWRGAGLAGVVPQRDNTAELAYWRAYLDWYGDGTVLVPALADALEWCAEHQPASEPTPSLRWGDVRLGNMLFDEERRPVGVLDWEMASIGAAEHDFAWTLALEATQAELFGRAVAGFLDRTAAIEHYEARHGRPVRDLEWYETVAMVRSTAIMTRMAHLRDRAGEPALFPITDNPVLGILNRRLAATTRRHP